MSDYQAANMFETMPVTGSSTEPPVEKRKKKKSKNTRMIGLLGVLFFLLVVMGALVAAGGAAQSGTGILVATQEIAEGSSVSVETVEIEFFEEEDDIDSGAFEVLEGEDVASAIGRTGLTIREARFDIPEGTQLTEATLATPLGTDERLMSISVDAAHAVAGTLQVGDSVDVVAVVSTPQITSNVVLVGAEIFGITVPAGELDAIASRQVSEARNGEELGRAEALPDDPIPGVYTLKIPADQVARMTVLNAGADLYLVARDPDANEFGTTTTDLLSALCAPTRVLGSDEELGNSTSGVCVGNEPNVATQEAGAELQATDQEAEAAAQAAAEAAAVDAADLGGVLGNSEEQAPTGVGSIVDAVTGDVIIEDSPGG